MHKRAFLFVVLAALAAFGSGCTPSVQLKSAVLQGGSYQGARFDAVMTFENPNSFDIQIKTVRANVRVDGIPQPIPVHFEPNVWLPAGKTVNIAVPVTIPWAIIPPLAIKTLMSDEVPFRIVGRADVVATRAFKIDNDNYAFNEEGTVPKRMFLQAGGGAPIMVGLGIPIGR